MAIGFSQLELSLHRERLPWRQLVRLNIVTHVFKLYTVGPEYSCSLRKIDMVKAVDGREFYNVAGFHCSYTTTVRRVAIQ